ncbi:carbohydrate ABC transporter permease [Streptomyces endophyticus]|uniref:Carbohydrate ABC transporter permease n=1 Tax=Streptomyces endophyticus TaxID=714166 RepID=A0ABU6EWN2_9ACTN|nr:carbohydrate ABC transporter permease [Streptomyces endophyticus]MEB8336082.1 carbohydrate ABC transporter permease [Streptomyces endophyticus]
MSRSRRQVTGVRRWLNVVNIGAFVLVLAVSLPLLWMAVTSFKSEGELGASPPSVLPKDPTWAHYARALTSAGFDRYLLNSAVVCLSATAIVLGLGLFSGYALGRLPLRGRGPIMVALLMISVFPTIAVVTPLYLVERRLDLLNSYWGLIIPYVAFHLPFAVWILRNSLLDIPHELEESATVDGASPVRTLLSVILPQARPALFTAGVFTFTATWTEFLMALTFNSADDFRTVPVGIALFSGVYEIPFGTIFAGAMAATVPIVLLVLIFRRSVLSGLTDGAVKG